MYLYVRICLLLSLFTASCIVPQIKYLNNLIEQDHRFIKRLTKPGIDFFSFETFWRTLQGLAIQPAGAAISEIREGAAFGECVRQWFHASTPSLSRATSA